MYEETNDFTSSKLGTVVLELIRYAHHQAPRNWCCCDQVQSSYLLWLSKYHIRYVVVIVSRSVISAKSLAILEDRTIKVLRVHKTLKILMNSHGLFIVKEQTSVQPSNSCSKATS